MAVEHGLAQEDIGARKTAEISLGQADVSWSETRVLAAVERGPQVEDVGVGGGLVEGDDDVLRVGQAQVDAARVGSALDL